MNLLEDATKAFLHYSRFEKKLSEKTIKAYAIDLKQLSQFLVKAFSITEINSISKTELRQYIESIGGLKPKSIKRKIATVKCLLNFLEFEDVISINPFRKMRVKIKEPKRLPQVLNLVEMNNIFLSSYKKLADFNSCATYKQYEILRDIAVVELLFATGARVSEIANLRSEHINLTSGEVLIKGKGDKERLIQICNKDTLLVLQRYFAIAKKCHDHSGDSFLVNRLGKRLSDQSIRTIVKGLGSEAKIGKHLTPHIFRHSFATLLLEQDVDIKYIQVLLGHSSIVTTQIYTHVNREKQRQILTAKHPRKEFVISL